MFIMRSFKGTKGMHYFEETGGIEKKVVNILLCRAGTFRLYFIILG
jgi:hypothetical protein